MIVSHQSSSGKKFYSKSIKQFVTNRDMYNTRVFLHH